MKLSMTYARFHENLIRMNSQLNELGHSLLKLQDQTGDLSHLYMQLEDLRTERYQIAEEFKAKHKELADLKREIREPGVTNKARLKAVHREIGVLHEKFRDLTPKVRDLKSTIKRKHREYNKARDKLVKYFRHFRRLLKGRRIL